MLRKRQFSFVQYKAKIRNLLKWLFDSWVLIKEVNFKLLRFFKVGLGSFYEGL